MDLHVVLLTLGALLLVGLATDEIGRRTRLPRVTLLVESGSAYDELRGVMIEGRAEISRDLDLTVATMVAAMDATSNRMPDVASIPSEVKQKMAGKRVLVRVRPERVLSWDHAKLPQSKTPGGLG